MCAMMVVVVGLGLVICSMVSGVGDDGVAHVEGGLWYSGKVKRGSYEKRWTRQAGGVPDWGWAERGGAHKSSEVMLN